MAVNYKFTAITKRKTFGYVKVYIIAEKLHFRRVCAISRHFSIDKDSDNSNAERQQSKNNNCRTEEGAADSKSIHSLFLGEQII